MNELQKDETAWGRNVRWKRKLGTLVAVHWPPTHPDDVKTTADIDAGETQRGCAHPHLLLQNFHAVVLRALTHTLPGTCWCEANSDDGLTTANMTSLTGPPAWQQTPIYTITPNFC